MTVLALALLACGASHRGDTSTETSAEVAAEALFDRDLHPALLAAFAAATTRIDVVQYTLYDSGSVRELVDGLLAAAERGVAVRVLADEEAEATQDALDRLAAGGVDARLDDPDQTTHNKLVIVDHTVFVGSHNWSSSAMDANHEGSARLSGSEVADFYAAVFSSLWQDSSAEVTASWTGSGPVTPLADASVAPALLSCLDGASERARLGLYAVAYDDRYPDSDPARLVEALIAGAARGVDVQVVLDGSDWIVDNAINDAAIALLLEAGVPVYRTPASVTTHAKVLLCDERVIVSDANWSYSSLVRYHGTSVAIEDAGVTAVTLAWWQGLRDSGVVLGR